MWLSNELVVLVLLCAGESPPCRDRPARISLLLSVYCKDLQSDYADMTL